MAHSEREPSLNVLTRYEVIAIAMPGAVLLLGLWYINPVILHGFEPNGASIGALGIFTVASFCAGHILQLTAIIIDRLIARLRGEPSDRVFKVLPENLRRQAPKQMAALLGLSENEVKEATSYRPYFSQMISEVRHRGDVEMVEVFTVARGLHQGLSAAFLLIAVAAVFYREFWLAAGCCALVAATAFMADIYSTRYSKEFWLQFLLLEVPRLD